MNQRAIRGATKLSADDSAEMDEAVAELLLEMIERNQLQTDNVISVFFTATPDIHCGFPAAAARKLGWRDIPLICSVEIDVPGALDHVVRVMMQVETDRPRDSISHVYLRGAEVLRLDIAQ